VRLSDLPRTTSFRLSVLFLALFGVSSLLLFGFLYWQTMSYLTNSVDDWLQRDAKGYLSAPADIARRLQGHAEHDPEGLRPFGLFDSQGRHLSGNLAAPQQIVHDDHTVRAQFWQRKIEVTFVFFFHCVDDYLCC